MGVGDVVGGLRKEKGESCGGVRCGKTKSQQLEFLGEVILRMR